jgi:hypothetical protein
MMLISKHDNACQTMASHTHISMASHTHISRIDCLTCQGAKLALHCGPVESCLQPKPESANELVQRCASRLVLHVVHVLRQDTRNMCVILMNMNMKAMRVPPLTQPAVPHVAS